MIWPRFEGFSRLQDRQIIIIETNVMIMHIYNVIGDTFSSETLAFCLSQSDDNSNRIADPQTEMGYIILASPFLAFSWTEGLD